MKRTRSFSKKASGPGWELGSADTEPADNTDGGAAHSTPPLARLRLEKRHGKPVTVVALEGLDPEAQRSFGKELKTHCGSGGTVKAGAVELQGDHRATLRTLLPQRGVRVKG